MRLNICSTFVYLRRSAAKLSYANAQKAIDGHHLSDLVVTPEHSVSAIENDVKALDSLAKQLRAKRFQDGALSLSSSRLSFKLDENGLPTDCEQYEHTEANDLVEEVSNSFTPDMRDVNGLYSSCS